MNQELPVKFKITLTCQSLPLSEVDMRAINAIIQTRFVDYPQLWTGGSYVLQIEDVRHG